MPTKTKQTKKTNKPAKQAEWVKPAKPSKSPTTLIESDYQYKDAKGNLRYFQGFDAAYKRALMLDSRNPKSDTSDRSVKVLVAKGWSTERKERDEQARVIAKAERAWARAARAKAAAHAAKAKAIA